MHMVVTAKDLPRLKLFNMASLLTFISRAEDAYAKGWMDRGGDISTFLETDTKANLLSGLAIGAHAPLELVVKRALHWLAPGEHLGQQLYNHVHNLDLHLKVWDLQQQSSSVTSLQHISVVLTQFNNQVTFLGNFASEADKKDWEDQSWSRSIAHGIYWKLPSSLQEYVTSHNASRKPDTLVGLSSKVSELAQQLVAAAQVISQVLPPPITQTEISYEEISSSLPPASSDPADRESLPPASSDPADRESTILP